MSVDPQEDGAQTADGKDTIKGAVPMRAITLLFASLIASVNAMATPFATDASDLWWNANESGWGVNVVQQNDTLFLTFFVYAANGSPSWYVAPANKFSGNAGGAYAYSGPLYQTNGPWFGGSSFNPNLVTNRQVGTATFTMEAVEAASLSYTVDGVTVFKTLRRQTWAIENISGSYLGASIGTYSGGCISNGYAEEPALISITQSGTAFQLSSQSLTTGAICNFSGLYVQNGRMGSVTGNVSCSNGASGTFNAFEIEGAPKGVTARAVTTFGSCQWTGRIGGLRRGS